MQSWSRWHICFNSVRHHTKKPAVHHRLTEHPQSMGATAWERPLLNPIIAAYSDLQHSGRACRPYGRHA